jgi:hypothetical protein
VPDQPVRSTAQATSAAAGPPSPVPGWVEMARVVLIRLCPSLHPLQTLLCAAFCAPEAVVAGILPVAHDQRMLVPVSALRRMLLAIACLGHLQQRPGSDLPQLRAGVLQWFTSPGLPAVEVLEVTSHLVWTHQTTDDPRQLQGPRSSLCSPRLHSPHSIPTYDTPPGPSPVCCPSTTTQCSRPGAGRRSCHHLYRWLWPVVARPMGEWVQGGLPALGCQWREGGWCTSTPFLRPMPLGCCGLRCPLGLRTAAAACFLGVCDRSGCPHSGAARVGGSFASVVAPVAG